MTGNEFSNQFDVLYNNITSNQAPGLNEYEKSVFLTKAQDELVKNYFLPQSNPKQAGFDGNQKRQMDFSLLMSSHGATPITPTTGTGSDADPSSSEQTSFDPRGKLFEMPSDVFIPINESLRFVTKLPTAPSATTYTYTTQFQRQVIPLSFEEYTRLMSKPYKEPLKYQAWRLLVNNAGKAHSGTEDSKLTEIVANHNDLKWLNNPAIGEPRFMQYVLRYIRRPKPIIVAQIDSYNVTINGKDGTESDFYTIDTDGVSIVNPCELDASLHEEILQRAIELAKTAWQGDLQASTQMGQRSE